MTAGKRTFPINLYFGVSPIYILFYRRLTGELITHKRLLCPSTLLQKSEYDQEM